MSAAGRPAFPSDEPAAPHLSPPGETHSIALHVSRLLSAWFVRFRAPLARVIVVVMQPTTPQGADWSLAAMAIVMTAGIVFLVSQFV